MSSGQIQQKPPTFKLMRTKKMQDLVLGPQRNFEFSKHLCKPRLANKQLSGKYKKACHAEQTKAQLLWPGRKPCLLRGFSRFPSTVTSRHLDITDPQPQSWAKASDHKESVPISYCKLFWKFQIYAGLTVTVS